jgi:hypothetical protein
VIGHGSMFQVYNKLLTVPVGFSRITLENLLPHFLDQLTSIKDVTKDPNDHSPDIYQF